MSQRRLERMNELLKEAVAELLLRKSKDPRLQSVNITGVKMTADLKKAVVHYSVLGGDEVKAATKAALAKATGFVRASVGETLGLKHTPEILFEFDRNLEYAQHMAKIFNGLSESASTQGGDDD